MIRSERIISQGKRVCRQALGQADCGTQRLRPHPDLILIIVTLCKLVINDACAKIRLWSKEGSETLEIHTRKKLLQPQTVEY